MEFSVLMSVYVKDVPEFFKIALESVTIEQTKRPNQVVIIQDGPVPEIINEIIHGVQEKVREIEFSIFKITQNIGLAAALNKGIALCKYNWIARMDADDISLPCRFEKQVNFIIDNPTVDVFGGYISEFQRIPGDFKSQRNVKLNHKDIIKRAKFRNPMNHMTVFYKKNAVISSGKYSEDFGKLEDYKLWIDMLLSGAIFSNINEVLVSVRVGNGFIERRSNHNEIVDWDALQRYLFSAGFISRLNVLRNKMYIRVFIYMPACFKKVAYKTILRK